MAETPDGQVVLPDWAKDSSAHAVPWDDGHMPSGCKNQPGRIVRTQKRSFSKQHLVLDDVISDELAQQVYDYTTTRETKVWGVYIHEAQIATARSSNANANSSPNDPDSLASDLATRVIQEFLYQHAKCKSILDHDRAEIHGIAVWAIASSVGQEVLYHIDYAEMFRYQTNIIYPPMYGATVHVSDLKNEMIGGDFYVYPAGLDHYATRGYKGMHGLESKDQDSCCVPYRYKRGIFCDGNLPHASSRIEHLPESKERVIIGLNVFNHEIGPFAAEFPEHSGKFNTYVKIHQASLENLWRSPKSSNDTEALAQPSRFTLDDVRKNPKLAKFLKLLLRHKKQQAAAATVAKPSH